MCSDQETKNVVLFTLLLSATVVRQHTPEEHSVIFPNSIRLMCYCPLKKRAAESHAFALFCQIFLDYKCGLTQVFSPTLKIFFQEVVQYLVAVLLWLPFITERRSECGHKALGSCPEQWEIRLQRIGHGHFQCKPTGACFTEFVDVLGGQIHPLHSTCPGSICGSKARLASGERFQVDKGNPS